MAMLACRNRALDNGIERPEMFASRFFLFVHFICLTRICCCTAHPAFSKAAEYFGYRIRETTLDTKTWRADVSAMKRAINSNTAVVRRFSFVILALNAIQIIASAPSFPHGMIDDLDAVSDLALKFTKVCSAQTLHAVFVHFLLGSKCFSTLCTRSPCTSTPALAASMCSTCIEWAN